nr:hypothetical protein [Tanacetum cinerariifolium]
MSSDSTLSAVTYTSVYSDYEPWRFQWVSDAEPQSLEAALQAPPSPYYVPDLKHPPSPDYVPGPEYLEYLALSDDDIPTEYQPLPAHASPTILSLGYIADSDLEEDPEDDPEKDPTDYPTNGGDEEEEEESSGDDADDEKEEHLAPTDSSVVPIDDHIPSPPLPLSPPPLPSPAPSSPLLLHVINRREDVPEVDVPPQKRLCLTTPTLRFEVRESSVAAAARQHGLDVTHTSDYSFVDDVDATSGRSMSRNVGYGIMDVWDDMVGDMEETTPTTLDEINMIHRDRRYFNVMAVAFEREAIYAHGAWAGSEGRSIAIEAHVRTLETQVMTLMAQTSSLQTQLTTALGRIQTLEAREPARTDDP